MKILETKSGYRIIQILSGRSNVFLLSKSGKTILIDTGPEFMWNTLNRRLKRIGITRIDYLILTHTHFDHAGNSILVKNNYNAYVVVHQNEASLLSGGLNVMPDGTNIFTKFLIKYVAKHVAAGFHYKACKPDILIDSQYDLNEMGFKGFIMPTPGHSIGSISIMVDDSVAIVGDAMFGVFKWSVFPPYAVDIQEMIRSWGKLLKSECHIFLPGHGSANSRKLLQKSYDRQKNKEISSHKISPR